MRYAIYLRKSRADDTSEPLEVTLQRHRQMLEKYMQQHDIAVQDEDVFEEVVSGDSLYARPQMLRLLEAVEAGTYTGVLCVDIQRLGRGSMQDQGMILDAFKWSDTKIITPAKVYDLSDDIDETYTEFESFMGRQEYKLIKKRLRRGLNATIENGGYIANAPYGYDKTKYDFRPLPGRHGYDDHRNDDRPARCKAAPRRAFCALHNTQDTQKRRIPREDRLEPKDVRAPQTARKRASPHDLQRP